MLTSETPFIYWRNYLIKIVLFALFYTALGMLGMSLALQRVTPVWPPSGLAVGALVWGGYALWPGIFLGQFLSNALYGFNPEHPFVSFLVISQMSVGASLGG